MRKALASLIAASWDFTRRHRFLAVVLGLITLATCAGGLYLVITRFPAYIPCLTGSCRGY